MIGVEDVPLPVVFLDVAERGADPALRRACVRAGRVELGQDGHVGGLGCFQRRHQPGAAGADDDGIIRMNHLRAPREPCPGQLGSLPGMRDYGCLNVKMIQAPMRISAT